MQNELTNHNKTDVSNKLRSILILRKKADYPPLNRLTLKQVNDCIKDMEYIFNRLPRRELDIY